MTHWEPIITSCTTNWSFIQAGIQWTNWKILTNSELRETNFSFFSLQQYWSMGWYNFLSLSLRRLRLYYLEKKIALWQENSNMVEDSSAISSVAGGSPLLFFSKQKSWFKTCFGNDTHLAWCNLQTIFRIQSE